MTSWCKEEHTHTRTRTHTHTLSLSLSLSLSHTHTHTRTQDPIELLRSNPLILNNVGESSTEPDPQYGELTTAG
jgi:hypothetical protein